jgi:hypothetical protein
MEMASSHESYSFPKNRSQFRSAPIASSTVAGRKQLFSAGVAKERSQRSVIHVKATRLQTLSDLALEVSSLDFQSNGRLAGFVKR